MKHIIWISPGFAASETDSTCIPPLQLLAKQLQSEANIELHIVSLHYPYTNKSYSWHSSTVHPSFRTGPMAKSRIRWAAFRKVRELAVLYPGAILHSFWLNDAALIGHWISKRYGNPHLVTLMGQDALPSNRFLPLFPLQEMNTVCLSKFHAETLKNTSGHKSRYLIPWGLDIKERFTPPPTRDYDVIGVGNLIPLKRYDWFVQIIAKTRTSYPNIRAVIIGEGTERKKLEDLIKKYGLEDNLQLLGSQPRKEVLKYMRNSRTLLHTSSYESFGFVLIEALSQGTKIISTPVGIAPELPGCQTAEEENQLLEALLYALERPALTENAVPYTMLQTKAEYLRLYNRLVRPGAFRRIVHDLD